MKLIQLAAIILTYIPIAYADSITTEIAKCADIPGELARLECYDHIAKTNNITQRPRTNPTLSDTGKWRVQTSINPIDDSKSVVLILDATSGKTRFNNTPTLIIRCISNKTDTYITWDEFLGNEAKVLYRIGSEPAKTREWSLSTDKQATFHPIAIPFLQKLLKTDKLLAQVTPYNESPITAIFDLTGIQSAMKPVRETCGW